MRPSINFEALRIALIQAVKVKAPDEFVCRVCETPFKHLNRVNIKGVGHMYICEHCVEEFNEYFKKKDEVGFEELFTNASGLLMGQRQLPNYSEEDMEDFGNYYDAMKYNMDRNI